MFFIIRISNAELSNILDRLIWWGTCCKNICRKSNSRKRKYLKTYIYDLLLFYKAYSLVCWHTFVNVRLQPSEYLSKVPKIYWAYTECEIYCILLHFICVFFWHRFFIDWSDPVTAPFDFLIHCMNECGVR